MAVSLAAGHAAWAGREKPRRMLFGDGSLPAQCCSRPPSLVAHNGDLGQLCFLVLIDVGNLSVTVPSFLFIDQFCYERGVQK